MAATLDASILALADRSHVVSALTKIAHKTPDLWLPKSHSAANGGLALKWPSATAAPSAEVIDGIAISAPTHCVDGWGFASRALSSLMAGDHHAARHMAYYAQLRASLSILANLGVGIFNGVNVVVDAAGVIRRIDPVVGSGNANWGIGTHQIVWMALKSWSSNSATAETFLDLVKLKGVSIREIITDIWPSFVAVGAAGGLIEAWGIDLKKGLDEREYRNTSSYAPQALNPLPLSLTSTMRFFEHLWMLFEPTAAGSFDSLDRHLLRSIVWKQRATSEPNTPLISGSIVKNYDKLPEGIQHLASVDFLTGKTEPGKLELLKLAEAKTSPASSLNMIARAFVLLRTATIFTQSSLTEAGVDRSNGALRPWMDELGDARGFWRIAAPWPDVDDLWEDTKVALEGLAAARKKSPSRLYDWKDSGYGGLPLLAEADRIAMWSFCR